MSEESRLRQIEETIRAIAADKWQAHQEIFRHRHQLNGRQVPAADFHPEMVADFWSDDQYSQILSFRGSAKSTIGEEDLTLAVAMRAYHNILIIGSSEARAAERLASVSYELAQNDFLIDHFGVQRSSDRAWTQTKLVTAFNCCVQAMGRDQDIRGIKFLDYRPDFVFVDDFEDKDNVQTPEGRAKTLRWFLAELLPACAPHCKVRIRATPMNAESVPMQLWRDTRWPTKVFPIEYRDDAGKRVASWPTAYSLKWIDDRRRIYESVGELGAWEREYMCRAVSDADQVFKKEMIRVAPKVKTHEACYAMIDPARTVASRSATTGWAVWSWVRNRLVVWGADAQLLLPDEIVALAFDIAERFDPVWVGVEQDGLEQFLLQPLRHEQARRGTYIPLRGVRAPRGKLDFIRGLQPFFAARECEFAQDLPALTEQLLNFPTGRIDAPNALAYALMMRPGLPIYENFSPEHINPDVEPRRDRPMFLVANATQAMTTAALVQAADGRLLVMADWVLEGSPPECVPIIYSEAMLAAGGEREHTVRPARSWDSMLKGPVPDRIVIRPEPPSWVTPPHHGERYTNVGLDQAIRAVPAQVRHGGAEAQGHQHLHDMLGRTGRGLPLVEIGVAAHWTLRALSGGYTRALVRGRVQDFAEEGPYRLLMEGLESFCAILHSGLAETREFADDAQPIAHTPGGLAYRSAMPQRN